jgi:dTDP-4-dehydrorhamnose 3,5-epimerase
VTPFTVQETSIQGVMLLKRQRRGDERGFLERLFDHEELREVLGDLEVRQINRTVTRLPGTVRGMHLQLPPNAEVKLVTCLRGSVWDVAVDLRNGSPTFGKWVGAELSETNGEALLVPEGCAHGLQTLVADCEMLYVHTAPHAPESEAGINPRNPEVAIDWPMAVTSISDRDASERTVPDHFRGVHW